MKLLGLSALAFLSATCLDLAKVGRAENQPIQTRATDDIVITLPILIAPTPGGWKVGYRKVVPGVLEITEFIPESDDIHTWTELFTIQNFTTSWGEITPELSLKRLRQIRESACPDVTQWTVLASDATSILYEWTLLSPCKGEPVQYEIAKILFGQFNRFLLRYTVKSSAITPSARQKWMEALMGARVELRFID